MVNIGAAEIALPSQTKRVLFPLDDFFILVYTHYWSIFYPKETLVLASTSTLVPFKDKIVGHFAKS